MTEKIKLISDSTCDLSKDLIEELNLEIVPLLVSYENEEKGYLDGVEITPQDIVKHVKETGKLPMTSAVGPAVYSDIFNKWIAQGYSIIYCGIGSQLSANYQSVAIGQTLCEKPELVTVIDSNNLSSATGICLLKIRDMLKEGLSRDEISERMKNEVTPFINSSFCIDSTDYMVKGGRCSAVTGAIAKIFSIKPIIKVVDGKLIVGKKPIGKITNAISTIYQDMMKVINDVDDEYLMITHCLSDDAAKYIEDIIRKNCNFKHIYVTNAGAIISSHCGPGTIGLLYCLKPKKAE